VEPLKKLHQRFSGRVHFVDVIVRQAHPGPGVPAYQSQAEKLEHARRYGQEHALPWVLAADDLGGTVHQAYGGMADPTYLLDVDGRVAFYNMWTYAPALHEALEALFAQSGRGVVQGGIDRTPYMLPALTCGWPSLEVGLPQSLVEMETAFPGTGIGVWAGYQLRPLLAPLAQRIEPLPMAAKASLVAGAAALATFGIMHLVRRRS
jgi:hypothetical protein